MVFWQGFVAGCGWVSLLTMGIMAAGWIRPHTNAPEVGVLISGVLVGLGVSAWAGGVLPLPELGAWLLCCAGLVAVGTGHFSGGAGWPRPAAVAWAVGLSGCVLLGVWSFWVTGVWSGWWQAAASLVFGAAVLLLAAATEAWLEERRLQRGG